jgi:hypothetical protein
MTRPHGHSRKLWRTLRQRCMISSTDSNWSYKQCCGSVTFWCGSGSGCGSADPCLSQMDPDPVADQDPAIFVIDLQDSN